MNGRAVFWAFPWPKPQRLPNGQTRSISINHMYVWTGRGGQRRLSTFAEGWKNEAIAIVLQSGWTLPPGPLALDISLYPPDRIRRDTDGPIKLAQDAVFEALGDDDYRVVDLHVRRHEPDRANPRIIVRVASDWRGTVSEQ